jgi:flagellar hook assembly protein FlgD
MAQFSSVEQLTNLAQSSQQAQSIALIGHTVAYADSNGNPGSGVVDAVTFNGGAPVLDVNGVSINPNQIVGVS